MLRSRHEALQIVTDDALEDYFDAQKINLLGKVEGIGIRAEGR